MEDMMKNMVISTEEDDDMVIEWDDLEENVEHIELCVVGKFLTD